MEIAILSYFVFNGMLSLLNWTELICTTQIHACTPEPNIWTTYACELNCPVLNQTDLFNPQHTHIPELNLDYVVDNPWLVIPVSALHVINIDQVINWLIKQSKR